MIKYIINDLYEESVRNLDKINKSRLRIAERVALEQTLAKLDAIKKILGACTITPQ